MTEEWFQELGPRWEKTTASKTLAETIDVHSHIEVPPAAEIAAPFFRPEFDPRVLYQAEESSRYNRELRATQVAKFIDPEARIADMDLQGVDRQVLAIAPPQYFYYLDEPTGARVTAIQNDRIAEMVASHPSRFVGVANLPLDHPAAAIAEMERAHRELGFNGFEINADVNGGELDDRRFDPLWEKAVELEMLVILHPHGFTEAQRMGDYYLANVICMPLASTLAVSRMILGGVWERFPDLKMLIVHGGGYLPFYFARTDHAYRVRPELRHHISRPERVSPHAPLRHHRFRSKRGRVPGLRIRRRPGTHGQRLSLRYGPDRPPRLRDASEAVGRRPRPGGRRQCGQAVEGRELAARPPAAGLCSTLLPLSLKPRVSELVSRRPLKVRPARMPMLDFFLSIADGIHAMFAGGMPEGIGVGASAAGALGASGAAAAAGSTAGRGDRGFRYSGPGTTVYDRPSDDGTVLGQAPSGSRLVYDSVVRDASGNPTHYRVSLPGGPTGYVPAGSTHDTRPTVRPPARPSVVIEGGSGLAEASSAQTAGSRG